MKKDCRAVPSMDDEGLSQSLTTPVLLKGMTGVMGQ